MYKQREYIACLSSSFPSFTPTTYFQSFFIFLIAPVCQQLQEEFWHLPTVDLVVHRWQSVFFPLWYISPSSFWLLLIAFSTAVRLGRQIDIKTVMLLIKRWEVPWFISFRLLTKPRRVLLNVFLELISIPYPVEKYCYSFDFITTCLLIYTTGGYPTRPSDLKESLRLDQVCNSWVS